MYLICLRQKYVTAINTIIRRFVWNNKKAKVSFDALRADKLVGGLRLIHVENKEVSLKAQWVQTFYRSLEIRKSSYSTSNP